MNPREWVRRGLALFGETERADVLLSEALERFGTVEEDGWEMWKTLSVDAQTRRITKDERELYETLRTTVQTTALQLRQAAIRFGAPAHLVPTPAKLPGIGKRFTVSLPATGSTAGAFGGVASPLGARLPSRGEVAGTFGWGQAAVVGIVAAIMFLIAAGLIASGRLQELVSPELYGRIRLAELQLEALRMTNRTREQEWEAIQEAAAAGIDPALVPRAPEVNPSDIGGPTPGGTIPGWIKGTVILAGVVVVGYGVYRAETGRPVLAPA